MLVIQELDSFSYSLIKAFLIFNFKIYYYKSNLNKKIIYKENNLIPIKFNQNTSSKRLLRYANLGDQDFLHEFAKKHLNQNIEKNSLKYFKGIKSLKKKLRLAFITSLNFHEIGSIYIHHQLSEKNNKLFLVHTNFFSYIFKCNGSALRPKVIHLYLPCDILQLLKKLINNLQNYPKKLKNFFLSKGSESNLFHNKSNDNENNLSLKKKTAILIHESFAFEGLYTKNHYFSDNLLSPLHISNIQLFIRGLERKKTLSEFDKKCINLKTEFRFKSFLKALKYFLWNIPHIRNIEQLFGLLFLTDFYLKYNIWIDSIKNYDIQNFIFDYDIQVSKSLSLALEKLNIKTISIQDRHNHSFSFYYGVIVDTYLLGGKISKKYALKNKSIIFNHQINLGMWRLTKFHKKDLVKIEHISFFNKSNNELKNYSKKICFVGFFYDPKENWIHTNKKSFFDFLNVVKRIAELFKETAIIIRMKELKKDDINLIMEYCSNLNNIFLCNDYENEAVSYRLCKDSDLIISVPTTLGEESLAYGKKVIFINELFPISNIAEDYYPEEYNFTIPRNLKGIELLTRKCLINDLETERKYKFLKTQLSGEKELSDENIIPQILEELLV